MTKIALLTLALTLTGCGGAPFSPTGEPSETPAPDTTTADSAPTPHPLPSATAPNPSPLPKDAASNSDSVPTMPSTPDAVAPTDAAPSDAVAAVDTGKVAPSDAASEPSSDAIANTAKPTLFIIFDRTTYTLEQTVKGPDAGVLSGPMFVEGIKQFIASTRADVAMQYEPIAVVRGNGILAPSSAIADYSPPAVVVGSSLADWESSLNSQTVDSHGWVGTATTPATEAAVAYLADKKPAAIVYVSRFFDDNGAYAALAKAHIPSFVISAKGTTTYSVNQFSQASPPYWCITPAEVAAALADIVSKL